MPGWIMDTKSMQTSLGLCLQMSPPLGKNKHNTPVILAPGSEVYMRGAPPGTFGIRHAPPSAAYGGGATVLIISDEASWYSGIDTHLGTVEAILNKRSRPSITYSSARSKDGRLDSAYSKWSRRFFEHLYQDCRTWSDNYSSPLDAEHSKIYMFLRQPERRSYICLGRYMARHFDGHVLTLDPIQTAYPRTPAPAMDLLASTAQRLTVLMSPINVPERRTVDPETDDDDVEDEQDEDDEPILQSMRRNVRQRIA